MLAEWLVVAFHEPGSPGAHWSQLASGGALTAVLLLSLFGVPRALRWARANRRTAAWLAGLALLGLVLRAIAPAGPMDIHHRLDDAAVPMERASSQYGLAFPTVVRLLWFLTGPSDAAVFDFDLIVGTATIAGVFALARAIGLPPIQALIAAAILAVHPAHVRFSHTDVQTILELALLTWGLAALFRPTGLADRLFAGLALGLASAMRPDAMVLPLVAVTGWLAVARRPTRSDVVLGLGALVALPSFAAWIGLMGAGGPHATAFRRMVVWEANIEHFLFLDPTWTPMVVAACLLLVPFVDRPSRWVRLWVVGWAVLLSVLVYGFSIKFGHLAAMRHQLRALPFVALGGGIGAALLVRVVQERGGTAAIAVAAIVGITTVPTVPRAWTWTTLNHEYRFVADHLADIPEGCAIAGVFNPARRDVGLIPPAHLSRQRGLGHQWVDLGRQELPWDGCLVYYRGSNCFAAAPGRPLPVAGPDGALPLVQACASQEALLTLQPLFTEVVPGVQHGTDNYPPGSTVELAFFDVAGRATDAPARQPTRRKAIAVSAVRSATPEQEREGLEARLAATEVPPLPEDWDPRAATALLEGDAQCPIAKVDCRDGLCVAASASPGCDRATWAVQARLEGGPEVMRYTWADSADGGTAVAVALVPRREGAGVDPAVQQRINAQARLLLHELIHGE